MDGLRGRVAATPRVHSGDDIRPDRAVGARAGVDHLACRRCGAPAGAHEDLTEELKKRNKRATAGGGAATKRPDGGRAARLSGTHRGGLDSNYYYAHGQRASDHSSNLRPTKLAGASESDSSDDDAVEYVGGSRQNKPAAAADGYYYAHENKHHAVKVGLAPEKIGGEGA